MRRIANSYITRDIYRRFRKTHPDISEALFGSIVKYVNKLLIEEFYKGYDIVFPSGMGKLELRKYKTTIKFEDGKVKTNRPPDWAATYKLWKEDEESRLQKKLVRFDQQYVYRIMYNTKNVIFKNKNFFKFTPARAFKRSMATKIINKELDAYLA